MLILYQIDDLSSTLSLEINAVIAHLRSVNKMSFTSEPTLSKIEAFAASDFRDLLDSIEFLDTATTHFLKIQLPTRQGIITAATHCKEHCDIARGHLETIKDLQQAYQDLDTHYGWVLAGDRVLVARVVGPRVGGEEKTQAWMKNTVERYMKTKSVLEELKTVLGGCAPGSDAIMEYGDRECLRSRTNDI